MEDSNELRKLLDDYRNFFILVIGKRRTGKSYFCRELVYQTKDFYDDVHIFSSTIDYQKEIYDFCPQENMYDHFNEEVLEKIYESQKKTLSGLSETQKKNKNLRLIIIDDLAHDPKVGKSKMLIKLATSGRHQNIAVIVCSQYYCQLLPSIRSNTDLSVGFYMTEERPRKMFINSYMGNLKNGNEIYNKIMETEHSCAVCNMNERNPNKSVKLYVANKTPKFLINTEKPKKVLSIQREQFLGYPFSSF